MGGREVTMFDHPRPTKVALSFVNRYAGILSGMLAVAKIPSDPLGLLGYYP